jgi:hypothetical protein
MTTKSTTYTLPHADRAPVARLAKQLTRPMPHADAEAARLRAEVQRLRTELAQTKASLLATEQAALDKAHREERLRPYLLREVDGLAAFRAKLGTRGAHRVHVVITGQTLAITDRHA